MKAREPLVFPASMMTVASEMRAIVRFRSGNFFRFAPTPPFARVRRQWFCQPLATCGMLDGWSPELSRDAL